MCKVAQQMADAEQGGTFDPAMFRNPAFAASVREATASLDPAALAALVGRTGQGTPMSANVTAHVDVTRDGSHGRKVPVPNDHSPSQTAVAVEHNVAQDVKYSNYNNSAMKPVPAQPLPTPTPTPANPAPAPNPSSRAAGKLPMTYPAPHAHPPPAAPRSARAQAKAPAPPPVKPNSAPVNNAKIWSTSSSEERERIREFWLGLGEAERRKLVEIEKSTVLRKMKEQQKHSCSCAVCGRKRCVASSFSNPTPPAWRCLGSKLIIEIFH